MKGSGMLKERSCGLGLGIRKKEDEDVCCFFNILGLELGF